MNESGFVPEVRVGKIGVLKVHQISDDELSRLETGSGQNICLNLAISVISVAVSFVIALNTATFEDDRIYRVFADSAVFGFILGVVLLIVWGFTRKPIKALAREIRKRMPPEGSVHLLPDFEIPLIEDASEQPA